MRTGEVGKKTILLFDNNDRGLILSSFCYELHNTILKDYNFSYLHPFTYLSTDLNTYLPT